MESTQQSRAVDSPAPGITADEEQETRRRRLHFLLYDISLPLGGYILIGWLSRQTNRDLAVLWQIFILPLALCVIRAGIGSRALRQPHVRDLSCWRRIVHQVLFALALLVLMVCEALSAVAGTESQARVVWLYALGVYGLYLLLRGGADRLLRRGSDTDLDAMYRT